MDAEGGSVVSGSPIYLVNAAHTDDVQSSGLTLPLAVAWTASFWAQVSYPLIAQGHVYVTALEANMSPAVFAFDALTGAMAWKVMLGSGESASIAYDSGRLFVIESGASFAGPLLALDATSGTQLWSAAPNGQFFFDAPPVAYGGAVYVYGSETGATVYAFDESTGQGLWSQNVNGGGVGSPVVSDMGVFVSLGCQSWSAFAPLSGSLLWSHEGSCTGGGESTPVLFGGTLFGSDPMGSLALDVRSGATIGTFAADLPPAFEGTLGFTIAGGALRALDATLTTVRWTFPGDGRLSTAPLVAGGYVFVGSTEGNIFAVDESTGREAWSDNVSFPLTLREGFTSSPYATPAVGDGVLAVPAQAELIVYRNAPQDAGTGDANAEGGCAWSLSAVSPEPPTGNIPASVATGDLDGDGRADLVVSNTGIGTVSTLLGQGDGHFGPEHEFTAGSGAAWLALGDLDLDGKLDVVVANPYSTQPAPSSLSLLLGNGDGTLQPQVVIPLNPAPAAVAVADFDADGNPDIAAAASGLTILLGKGNGTFQPAVHSAAGVAPYSLCVDDLNGDGRKDIVMADYGALAVEVMIGRGDGTFSPPMTYGVGARPSGVATGDVNGDGHPDIAAANNGDTTVSILLGKGDGTFQAQRTAVVGLGPSDVVVVDVDHDGRSDLAVTNSGTSTISILLGRGDGTFEPQVVYGTGAVPSGITSGDFNGDGMPDLAAADSNEDDLAVFLGRCGP